jgi:hypothetical protein
MRWLFLFAGVATMLISAAGMAQESLCNPCVHWPGRAAR